MTARELWTLEHGDTGAALLAPPCKVNGSSASVAHSDRDKSEKPTAKPATAEPAETIVTDPRVKRLVALSRWERAGMLAYIAATFPDAFDEAYDALGLGSTEERR